MLDMMALVFPETQEAVRQATAMQAQYEQTELAELEVRIAAREI